MHLISYEIVPIAEVSQLIDKLFEEKYSLHKYPKNNSIVQLNNYLNSLKEDIYVLVEYPYVDKVYRDSYYHYYSSKNQNYHRDCVRLSFFNKDIDKTFFRDAEKHKEIRESYLGFVVLRPTFPQVIGRSVIAPSALKESNFKSCITSVSTTANGLKLNVKGFPHASQNSETITCAETTIWCIMEYFGMRYPEYTPTLPSKISKILAAQSFERIWPSKGLTAQQISYALRELGFGVKVYSNAAYGKDFLQLLRIYVESGIPVVVAIQNAQGIGHAQCVIGRAKYDGPEIDGLSTFEDFGNNVNVFDFETMTLEHVFMDDNHPPYRVSQLESPAGFYSQPEWADCVITNFVVPLYSKIYLDAGEARAYAKSILRRYINNLKILNDVDIVMKVFLASSRSYKDYLNSNATLDPVVKELLLRSPMPKFVWISEISNKELLKEENVNGFLIIDATATKSHGLIAGLVGKTYFTENLNEILQINISLQPFKCYQNNLS